LAIGGLVVVALLGGAAALAFLNSPGNVSNPGVEFSAPQPAPKPHPRPNTGRDWPLYGLTPERTRAMLDVNVAPPYRTLWHRTLHSLIEFQPVLAKGTLYVLPNDGRVYAISARTGKLRWQRKAGALAASSPTWHNGKLFLVANGGGSGGVAASGPGTVWCLDAKTGRIAWSTRLASASESSPLVTGGRVYLGSQDGTVYALSDASGAIEWRWKAGGAVKAGIAISQGRLFVGDYSGQMTALRPDDGSVIWQASSSGLSFGRSGNFYATPAVAFGRVYAGNTDGFIYSFAARTGRLAWRHGTGAYVYSAPVVAAPAGMPPAVFEGSYSGEFLALDARTGSVLWSYPAGGTISGAASLIGRVVYFSTLSKKTTTGLDARTGHVVWRFGHGAFDPAISDGRRLYLTGYSSLYGFEPRHQAAGP
jgi:outer membrane protein assembly factor BamB